MVTAAVAAAALAPSRQPLLLGQDAQQTTPLLQQASPNFPLQRVQQTEWHGLELRQLGEVRGVELRQLAVAVERRQLAVERRQLGLVHGMERQHTRERHGLDLREDEHLRGQPDCRPTVQLPANASFLRDVSTMTLAEVGALLGSRQHSNVYMPLICAAVARFHPNIVRLSMLMGHARWNRILQAARVVLPHVAQLPWLQGAQGGGLPYIHGPVQEQLLHNMTAAEHQELQLFCASLP